ncbi:MAG: sugar phosphorylase, partial [Acidobacteria bacterium]
LLELLYGEQQAQATYPELERLMRVYWAHKTREMIEDDRGFVPAERFTEKDAILITYGDLILAEDETPLQVLARILDTYSRNLTTIHILPFFPYSSDRGFSVVDFEEVDPCLGSWEDIEQLGDRYRLMFDGVINHISSKSRWFQEFLNGNPDYEDFFIRFATDAAISEDHLELILRPRASELLTPFETLDGRRFVWTTFSADQIDLNYKHPKVLLRILEILLYYVRRGADLIRLDAATYLWAELGTECAHLKQTHALIKLFRAVLDVVAPRVALVSETNVPHEDNISYFGDGTNEAQMIYNFALPPLVLLSFQTGDSSHLSRWASSLERVSDRATYFNFLDSHDGVGLLPIKDIVPAAEIEHMIERVVEHGGLVSYRTASDGTRAPYELNVTWWSALNREDTGEPLVQQVDRFIASRAISFALMGVPGIYIASMVGTRNDREAVEESGEARAINRRGMDAAKLEELLADPESPAGLTARRMRELLAARVRCPGFHPNAAQQILIKENSVFSLLRESPDRTVHLLALVNVTAEPQEISFSRTDLGGVWPMSWSDLLSETTVSPSDDTLDISLTPYQVLWLASGLAAV